MRTAARVRGRRGPTGGGGHNYDEFDRLYDQRFAAWSARFADDLQR